MISIPAADGTAEALVCRPSTGSGPWPGVLLFMDAIGLRPQIQAMAQRIADAGYVVLAPNTLYRSGTVAETAAHEPLLTEAARAEFFAGAMPRLKTLTGARCDADVVAYVAALRALPDVADGPIGVVGYCMGARFSVRAAGLCPDDVAAAAGFHGGSLATDAADSPHRHLATARAEFVFGHADGDKSMDPAQVARLGAALADAGLAATNEVYAGARHGYTMADTAMYDEAAAERAMAATLALFGRALGGEKAGSQA